jgi:hypothetical protein
VLRSCSIVQAFQVGWEIFKILLFGEHFRIDIAFPQLNLAIEIDGWAFHRSKERRDRDIRKANGLTRTGWRVLTFNWDDVIDRPRYFIDAILEVWAFGRLCDTRMAKTGAMSGVSLRTWRWPGRLRSGSSPTNLPVWSRRRRNGSRRHPAATGA